MTQVKTAPKKMKSSSEDGGARTKSEKAFSVFNYIFLTLAGVITLYPFINQIAVSFSSNRAIMTNAVNILPVEFTLEAYKRMVYDGGVFLALKNNIVLTVGGTVISMLTTILAAYPLSKPYFPGKKTFMVLFTITMFFGGGLIPTYILMNTFNLMNTYAGLWILTLYSTYNMIILRTTFSGIPKEMEESAMMDGANDIVILFKIMLPMTLPTLATLTLFYMVGWWNTYMQALYYINTPEKIVLMLKLNQLLEFGTADTSFDPALIKEVVAPESVKAASIVVATVPILMVYPFLQKYFVKGMTAGAVKG